MHKLRTHPFISRVNPIIYKLHGIRHNNIQYRLNALYFSNVSQSPHKPHTDNNDTYCMLPSAATDPLPHHNNNTAATPSQPHGTDQSTNQHVNIDQKQSDTNSQSSTQPDTSADTPHNTPPPTTTINSADRAQAVNMIHRMQYWKKDAGDLPEPLSSNKSQSTTNKLMTLPLKLCKSLYNIIIRMCSRLYYLVTHPSDIPQSLRDTWKSIRHELHHYWTGSKLFAADIRTAKNLIMKTTQGNILTRREKRQLKRTFIDTLRIIPFSVFIIVPFMELLLPVALKLFPNMLPSTFRDQHKTNESIKRELRLRLSMAEFLQESLESMAKEKIHGSNSNEIKKSAEKFLTLIDTIRQGHPIPTSELISACQFFTDDITLDNLSRSQLVSMCKYMNINTFGTDEMLRYQFEQKLNKIKSDDKLIMNEGIESLSLTELKQACRERGMRSDGLTRAGYIRNLSQWMDLSLKQNIPSTLLILSRAFSLRERQPSTDDIRNALSSLDSELLDEVIRDAGLSDYEQKLESLKRQNELIHEEEIVRKNRIIQLRNERTNELMDRIYNVRPDLKILVDQRNKKSSISHTNQPIDTITSHTNDNTDQLSSAETIDSSHDASSHELDDHKLARQVASELASLANPSALLRERHRLDELKQKTKKAATERKQAELLLNKLRSMNNENANNKLLHDDEKKKLHSIIQYHESQQEQLDQAEARVHALIHAKHIDTQQAQDIIDQQRDETKQQTNDNKSDNVEQSTSGELNDEQSIPAVESMDREQSTQTTELSTDTSTDESSDSNDKSTDRLQSRINSMVSKLEQRLNAADISIGDKLHILDLDQDNIINENELSDALKLLFDHIDSDSQAHRVAKYIAELCEQSDSNTITVKQLTELADRLENEKNNDVDDVDDENEKKLDSNKKQRNREHKK